MLKFLCEGMALSGELSCTWGQTLNRNNLQILSLKSKLFQFKEVPHLEKQNRNSWKLFLDGIYLLGLIQNINKIMITSFL